MSAADKSVPAFPVPLNPGQAWQGMAPCDGMTLRDYFAARALPTLLREYRDEVAAGGVGFNVADDAYAVADAMLKARKT